MDHSHGDCPGERKRDQQQDRTNGAPAKKLRSAHARIMVPPRESSTRLSHGRSNENGGMSALPPYNATGTNSAPDVVLILDVDLDAYTRRLGRALASAATLVVAASSEALAHAPEAAAVVQPEADILAQVNRAVAVGEVAVVAPEAILQTLFAALMQTPPDAATVRFLPGCITRIQPLPGRAVLRHLNLGGA